jgi:nitrogen fixation NifU-like protein
MRTELHFEKHKEEIETGLKEEDELYKENILDHYKNPHNKESMKNPSSSVRELNPTCGDEITLFLKVEKNKITKATFIGNGCAISQASTSMLTDKLKNMDVREAKKIKTEDIFNMLGIHISVPRIKCALLSLKATTAALRELKA